jgi:hypothetical protein
MLSQVTSVENLAFKCPARKIPTEAFAEESVSCGFFSNMHIVISGSVVTNQQVIKPRWY